MNIEEALAQMARERDEARAEVKRLLDLVRSVAEPEATFWLVGVKHAIRCTAKIGQPDETCPVCRWIAKVLEAQTIVNAWPASGKQVPLMAPDLAEEVQWAVREALADAEYGDPHGDPGSENSRRLRALLIRLGAKP